MELELREIKVRLSNKQKEEIRNAFINGAMIRLRLTKDVLRGPDTLLIPRSRCKEMDNEDGIDADVDEKTVEQMQDQMRRELKFYRDDNLSCKMSKNINYEAVSECFRKTMEYYKYENLVDGKLSDETLEKIISIKLWEYYGLFFEPAIDESKENEGIDFFLDYSCLNDLAKDFVKDNIKNLFQ